MGINESVMSFESFDGVRLEGTFTQANSDARAMCIFVHGITADRHEWGTFDRIAEMLANKGICSIRFDYRCHGVAGSVADRDLTLTGVANDIDASYEVLSRNVGVRVPLIMVAASFGAGVSARWALDRYSGKLALLILLYPVLDYEADLKRVNVGWRNELREHGTITYGPKLLARPFVCEVPTATMINSLQDAASATLIFHGEEDGDVPIEESELASDASERVQLFRVPGCDHGFAAAGDPDLETEASQRNVAKVVNALEREIEGICF